MLPRNYADVTERTSLHALRNTQYEPRNTNHVPYFFNHR